MNNVFPSSPPSMQANALVSTGILSEIIPPSCTLMTSAFDGASQGRALNRVQSDGALTYQVQYGSTYNMMVQYH